MICTANNAAFVLDYAIFWLHTSELGGGGGCMVITAKPFCKPVVQTKCGLLIT